MKLTRTPPRFDLGHLATLDPWLRHSFAGLPSIGHWLDNFFPNAVSNRLAADVYEDEGHYYVQFELPGVKKEDLNIELHDRLLTVTATHQDKQGENERSYQLRRTLTVPEGVRSDAITAKLEDGLLTVSLPKPEANQPKRIDIQ
jgi:HSP20 family protein